MSRSTSLISVTICLFVIFATSNAFTPLEFLKNIQQTPQPQSNPGVNHQAEQPKKIFRSCHGNGPLMIKGCLAFSEEPYNKNFPKFRVCFEGKETMSDEDGFFSIPVEEDQLEKYTLVIAKTLRQDFDQHNNVNGLRLFADKSYKCYTFKKRGSFGGSWVQREKDLSKKQLIIPTNAIIVLVDPKYVDHLDTWNVNLASNFIKLPKIILKKEIKNKTTDRAAAKSLLTSLDSMVFHEEVREEVKQPSAKVKLTLAQ